MEEETKFAAATTAALLHLRETPPAVPAPRPPMPTTIATAIVRAQAAVRPVGKDGHNKFDSYRYTKMDTLADEARRAMTSAGLALAVLGARPIIWEGERRLEVLGYLVHESGDMYPLEHFSMPVIAVGKKGFDKAEAAALTYSRGGLALCILQIAREDEHAPDQRGDEHDAARKRPEKSSVDPAASIAAFEALMPTESAQADQVLFERYLEKANRLADQLSQADYDRLGAAITRAEKRLNPEGGR